jgi:lipopolysaccharide/colanic/teichoic acid biosynthesis glycosyltransferase
MADSDSKMCSLSESALQQGNERHAASHLGRAPIRRGKVLDEQAFHAMLTLERRRVERSRRPFVLMLLGAHSLRKNERGASFVKRLTSAISGVTRETDMLGWYEDGVTFGVIFTEINLEGMTPTTEILHSKVVTALGDNLDPWLASKLAITTYIFPEDGNKRCRDEVTHIMYQGLPQKGLRRYLPAAIKRAIDIVGSFILLLLFSPLLAAIAVAIKLGSEGPVIFKQERVGQFGIKFDCLKFRSMYTNNDPDIHRDYVQSLIAGKAEKANKVGTELGVYKITSDPRVTLIGKFLRKTSLDEFPQFWNVLRGEMSLVGPRPPVPYEFEVYDLWHRRRVLEMKPGVTGLWQVNGRSRVCFDDMVRLDLRYSQGWSLWLDLKILLATPLAVLEGDGAF